MANPMIRIHDLETNTILDREMTDEEFAQIQVSQADAVKRKTEEDAKTATKQALLAKLGITEDEAKLLLS